MSEKLRGTLLSRNPAEKQINLKNNLSIKDLGDFALAAETSSATNNLIEFDGSKIEKTPDFQETSLIAGRASILEGVVIDGMIHISSSKIDTFSESKVPDYSGKFGRGTYFTLGKVDGETLSGLEQSLANGDSFSHVTKVAGKFLMFSREDIKLVEKTLKDSLGDSPTSSSLKSTINNANIMDLASRYDSEITGIIIFMDDEKAGAEVVISPKFTENIEIQDVN
jgi:hypothetical protein